MILELGNLHGGNACHKAEVIIIAALLVAAGAPIADIAVCRRLRVGLSGFLASDRSEQTELHLPIIGGKICKPITLGFKVGPRRNNAGEDRQHALHFSNEFRVKAQLEYGAAFGFPGKLGVGGLVGPIAEVTWCFNAAQNISTARPGTPSQCALDDHLNACAHGGDGLHNSIFADINAFNQNGRQALGAQMVDIGQFVLLAALPERLKRRIEEFRTRVLTARCRMLQLGQVPAVQIPHQICCAETRRSILNLHEVASEKSACFSFGEPYRALPHLLGNCLPGTKLDTHRVDPRQTGPTRKHRGC
ncbi:hypothetical protein GGQ88_003965 [Novosphingobium hassiacum]|uniref:Uncharacterized protein n=1 Tax=Novosphingobium hassiacum TaxID=173676 RepID=A0A7W6A0T6_9SPHN|nr:hypothetical protein [Novosphingobium hassiacum]